MDVVYLVKPNDNNEELRHSLRSLRNLNHDRVWTSGYQPNWVRNAGSIYVRRQRSRGLTTTLNLAAACKHKDVSDPFILFNDDFFVLHPIDKVSVFHRGSMAAWIESRGSSPYTAAAEKTLAKLRELGYEDPLSYDLHYPLVIHKQLMLDAIEHCKDIRGAHKRSVYGNIAGLGGEMVADCKIRDQKRTPDDDWVFASTEDGAFACGAVGDYLKSRFSDPSPYERRPRASSQSTRA